MKHHLRNSRIPAQTLALTVCCLILFLAVISLTACGKKGDPKSPGTKNTFSWVFVDANIRNNCINVRGRLQGDYNNMESIRLEVEPTGNIDDCIDCPFNPLETEVFYASDLNMSADGEISLLYCPEQKSHIYRWRLIATNSYRTLPNAMTPVLTVEDPAGPLPWD